VYSSTDPLVLELEGLHAYVDDISSEISHITNDLDRNRYRQPTIVKEVLDLTRNLLKWEQVDGRVLEESWVHEPTLANMEA
jgi:hypothetical protein